MLNLPARKLEACSLEATFRFPKLFRLLKSAEPPHPSLQGRVLGALEQGAELSGGGVTEGD